MEENNINSGKKLFSIWDSLKENKKLIFLFIGINLLIYTLLPLLLTYEPINITNYIGYGEVGDTIGGTVGPAVAIVAALFTFLAFLEQLKLNKEQMEQFGKQETQFNDQFTEQKRQFKLQLDEQKRQFDIQNEAQEKITQRERFQTHFFELLKLYIDFVKEMELKNNSGTTFMGKKVFLEMIESLKYLFKHRCIKHHLGTFLRLKRCYISVFEQNFNALNALSNEDLEDGWHIKSDITIQLGNNQSFAFMQKNIEDLEQYLRILHQILKYITNYDSNILSDKEKYQYIVIFRTQISPQEQEILLFHSLFKSNFWIKQGYLTKWRMTKNVRIDTLLHDFKIDLGELYKVLGVSEDGIYREKDDIEGEYVFEFAEQEAKDKNNA